MLKFSQLAENEIEVARYGTQIHELDEDHKFWRSPNYLDSDYLIIASRYVFVDIKNLNFVSKDTYPLS